MKYKLVIFDFDGTLADSFPFFLEAFNTLADTHGFRRVAGDELDAFRRYDARQLMKHVGFPLWKTPRVAAHFRALMADNIDRIPLFQGVDRMLRRLSDQDINLAIVTSNSYGNVRAVLGPENAPLIAHYECGASLFGKRARLRRVLARSGVRADEVLCVGDEIRDIEAARGENLAFGAVAWGYARLDSLLAHAPELVFSSVDDIPEALAGRFDGGKPVRPDPL